MYKFKYHPDGWIFQKDHDIMSFTRFIAENPMFPIIEGEFFEYYEDGAFDLIKNENGTWIGIKQDDISLYHDLINAINYLE